MKNTRFSRLQEKMEEVYLVEPNDLGFATGTKIYRRINGYFKTMPFLFIIPVSFLAATVLYLLFGPLIVRLTTMLQYGF